MTEVAQVDESALDPAEALIKAWIDWETTPSSYRKVLAKEKALHALELNSNQAHDHIAAYRRAGHSIPDAVQDLLNEPCRQEAA